MADIDNVIKQIKKIKWGIQHYTGTSTKNKMVYPTLYWDINGTWEIGVFSNSFLKIIYLYIFYYILIVLIQIGLQNNLRYSFFASKSFNIILHFYAPICMDKYFLLLLTINILLLCLFFFFFFPF